MISTELASIQYVEQQQQKCMAHVNINVDYFQCFMIIVPKQLTFNVTMFE